MQVCNGDSDWDNAAESCALIERFLQNLLKYISLTHQNKSGQLINIYL